MTYPITGKEYSGHTLADVTWGWFHHKPGNLATIVNNSINSIAFNMHDTDNILYNSLLHAYEILVSLFCRWGKWVTEWLCHLTKFRQPPMAELEIEPRKSNSCVKLLTSTQYSPSLNSALILRVLKCPLVSLVLRTSLFFYSLISLHYFNAWNIILPIFFVALNLLILQNSTHSLLSLWIFSLI